MSQNTSIAPERDTALLKEFSLSAEPTVRRLLQTIAEEEHEVYVYPDGGDPHFVTEVLKLDWEAGALWLGTPYDKTLSAPCNASTPFIAVAFPDGVKVQFNGLGLLQTSFEGTAALRIQIPKTVVRLQRRNYFRVVADEELNRQVGLTIPGMPAPHHLVDISLAGCCFTVEAPQDFYCTGQPYPDAILRLPDGEPPMRVNLEIRNVKPLSDHPEQVQLGCEMKPIERGAERRLQRFLLATERRQRAMLHAMD
ncbi:MAG TPA: flagellar regulator YcgR PilZN domain-containing protein [Limnobacter sp.]|nr:flagellar regulator YcgR PilZN domain-containing protein [Limnobacter sp.]